MSPIRALALGLLLVCCAPGPASRAPAGEAEVLRPPPEPAQPARLRVEPRALAVRAGEAARLRVLGEAAARARCSWDGGSGEGPTLQIPGAATPRVLRVVCEEGEARAEAEVTWTESVSLPVTDPYAGGVVLLKLRRAPDGAPGVEGRQHLGLGSLDALLERLGAFALPAFPFALEGTLERVGLSRWVAIDLPEGVHFYQAVRWLREDPNVHPESYLPEDARFVRVHERAGWPVAIALPGAERRPRAAGGTPPVSARASGAERLPPDLEEIGVREAWRRTRGEGVLIGVVDTGVDVNHVALSEALRDAADPSPSADADGNGIPGDGPGVNLAHLAVAHGSRSPRLALGLVSDVGDWDGALGGGREWGHGTALAAAAAGTSGSGVPPGVAPGARILAVDVQENLRASPSSLAAHDPRMRAYPPAQSEPLRSSAWARAAGVVYAVTEGARVVTCAWPASPPHWIVRDALLFAEENCAIAICASPDDAPGQDSAGVWRRGVAREGGPVHDPWTGETRSDFHDRPLRALTVAGFRDTPAGEPDLRIPESAARGIASAVSNPRNDATPGPDRRVHPFGTGAVAAGRLAGAAALVTAARPDLEPPAVRGALLDGARPGAGGPELQVAAALAAASRRPKGSCEALLARRSGESEPWWRRVKVRTGYERKDPTRNDPICPKSAGTCESLPQ